MKKSVRKAPVSLPISKKAYFGFIDRINAIFSSDKATASLLCDALDSYLSGDTDTIDYLPGSLRFAFAFLCQDIDCAIRRSARARQRANLRKANLATRNSSEKTSTQPAVTVGQKDLAPASTTNRPTDRSDSEPVQTAPLRPMTRQQRRAMEREARKKHLMEQSSRAAYVSDDCICL